MANEHRIWPVPYFPGEPDKPAEQPTFSEKLVAFLDDEIDRALFPPPEFPGPRVPHISSDASRPWRETWPKWRREAKR
jgi:hypothetical protein